MKTLLFLLCCSCGLLAQKPSDKTAILTILDAQTKHWNAGNIDAFMDGYWVSDSLMFIGKSGVTYGYAATKARYHKSYPDTDAMGQLAFNVLKVDFLAKNTAWVLGKWHLDRPKAGDIGGHYTLVFKKIKGKWQIVSDHSS